MKKKHIREGEKRKEYSYMGNSYLDHNFGYLYDILIAINVIDFCSFLHLCYQLFFVLFLSSNFICEHMSSLRTIKKFVRRV